MKKIKWLLLGGLLFVGAVISGSWVLTEKALRATSGEAFCTSCHTMAPFAASYREDVHGGNNPKGLRADCADCHLPHRSPEAYLAAKVQTGLYDLWAEGLARLKRPNWVGNRERRNQYVYDSGCLRCHGALHLVTNPTQAAALAHETYFKDEGDMRCVNCHTAVGHKDLLSHLSPKAAGDGGASAPASAPGEPAPSEVQ